MKRRRWWSWTTAIVLLLLVMTVAAFGQIERRQYSIRHVAEGPPIDGELEPVWQTVRPATGFVQAKPFSGRKASEPTRVYLLHTQEALYVAFEVLDSSPDSVVARMQRRDQDEGSDRVYIALDTFHDLMNGYFFGVTAAGVQIDGTIAEEDEFDDTWDGIWQSAVAHHDSGWVAEMRIPFFTFRHGGTDVDAWGMNLMRMIQRRNEEDFWQPIDRQRGQKVGEFGLLRGMVNLRPRPHVEVLPHVVGRWDQPDQGPWRSRNDFDNIGVDLKIVPSPSWTVDLTYQPDFAQVEVDDEVINLTDYPVYLPEKRPFFLEGLDIFRQTEIQLLYTRKITDPVYGARVTGQWSDLRGSALAAQNETATGSRHLVAAGRGAWSIGQSRIGATLTSLSDHGFHAHAIGLDGRYRWGAENRVDLMVSAVDRTESPDQPVGGNLEIYMAADDWKWMTSVTYMGKDYDVNDLGFTGYSNKINQYGWIQRSHYPEGTSFESMHLNFNGWQEVLPAPGWQLHEYGGNVNGHIQTRSNYWLGGGMGWGRGYWRERTSAVLDTLDEGADWKYVDNFGRFDPSFHPWWERWINFETDDRKPVELEGRFQYGTFREGKRYSADLEMTVRPLANLDVRGSMEWIHIWDAHRYNDGAATDYRVGRVRVRYSPTLTLSLRGTLQYVTEEDVLISNMLLAWNWSPGSWFYLVYDESRGTDLYERWDHGDRTLRLKWTWFTVVS